MVHGMKKSYAGNPHVRLDEGDDASVVMWKLLLLSFSRAVLFAIILIFGIGNCAAFTQEWHNWGTNTGITPAGVPGEKQVSGSVTEYRDGSYAWTTKAEKHGLILREGQEAKISISGLVRNPSSAALHVAIISNSKMLSFNQYPITHRLKDIAVSSFYMTGSVEFSITAGASYTSSVGQTGIGRNYQLHNGATTPFSSCDELIYIVLSTSGSGNTETIGYTLRCEVSNVNSSGSDGGSGIGGGSATTYTVTYKPGPYSNESTTYTATKDKGVLLALRNSTYSRTGYTQTAWSISSTGTSRDWELGEYILNSDITLYPYWTANTYKVTFNQQNGSGGTSLTTATYGSAMPSITSPTRNGYIFGGYYTSTGGNGTQYYTSTGASAQNWDLTSETVLYAKWTADPRPNNDDFANAKTISGVSGTLTGSNVGATMQSSEPTPSVQPNSKCSVWYKWTSPSSGAVTFDTIGSSFNTVLGAYTGSSISSLSEIDSDDDSGGGAKSSMSFQVESGTTYRIAVYGYDGRNGSFSLNWSLVSQTTKTVSFVTNGGSSCADREYTVGSTYGALPSTSKTGYTFDGWYTSSAFTTKVTASSTVSSSVSKLYAKWTAKTYTVTLNQQDGSGGTPSTTATYGSSMPSITLPTRDGYTFGGYYTINWTQYYTSSGASARNWDLTSATTLYAEWTASGPSWTIEDGVLTGVDLNGFTDVAIPNTVTSIGSGVFNGCSALTSVTIPDSVTSIEPYAFMGCSGLTSVTIPASVTSIGYYAFYGCSGLISIFVDVNNADFSSVNGLLLSKDGTALIEGVNGDVIVPNSVSSIWNAAFGDRSGLTSVTIPDSVMSIGNYAFDGCTGLTSVTMSDNVTDISYGAFRGCSNIASVVVNGDLGVRWLDVDLRASITNVTLTSSSTNIGYSAFDGCSGLTSVTIHDRVTSIGSYAFGWCSGLTNVTIPDSVTSIGNYAFDGCSGLTSVSIGNSVTNIGDYAFYNCSGLTSVAIPDGVAVIGDSVFSGCSGLTSVAIPDSVTSIWGSTFSGCSGIREVVVPQFICNKTKGMLLIFPSSYSSITNVVISDSVTSIGSEAFYGCSGLTSVTIPDSVTRIGFSAFEGCNEIRDVVVSQSLCTTKLSSVFPSAYSSITNVVISDSVTSIGDRAFAGFSGLTSVTIPDGVMSIGDYAFSDCSSLTNVTIGNSVTSIGRYAFYGCSGLTSVAIPDGVAVIGDSVFSGCSGLASVTIPDSVMNIWRSAFFGCSRIRNVVVPQYVCANGMSTVFPEASYSITNVVISDSVTSIGDRAFDACNGLTSVTIGNSVTSIGVYAFRGCSGLTSVTIGNGVTNVGAYAFGDCSGLTSVTIGNGVTNVGAYAFRGCSGLTSVVIPDSVTSIGGSAFAGCSGLTSVTIGNGVTNIGSSAFYGCSGLTNVTIPDNVTIAKSAFGGCSGLMSITVESGNRDYKSVNGLLLSKDGKTLIHGVNGEVVIPSSVTNIEQSAFYGLSGLTSMTIPDSVTSIGQDAFSGCSGLTNVTMSVNVTIFEDSLFRGCSGLTSLPISDSVTSIGYDAFYHCIGLTSVTIPDSVMRIGGRAFTGCSGLTSVTIGNGVTNIESSAFYGCSGLASVTIPDSVMSIGNYAFDGCSGLTSVSIGKSVMGIGSYAFYECSGIASVTIPDSVTNIGTYAFVYCSRLTNFVFKGNAPMVDSDAFYGVKNGCTAYVRRGSTGWGVEIPGTWNGINIEYIDDEVWTVAFDANGGMVAETERTVTSGCSIGELPVAMRDGYAFDGWFSQLSDAGSWVSVDFVVTTNLTLYANWRCNHASTSVQNARAATCTAGGYRGDTVCSTCGTTIATGSATPALGHQEGVGVVTKEPTATEEGVTTYSCTRCGVVLRTEAIPKIVVALPDLGFAVFSDWDFGYSMFTTIDSGDNDVFDSAPVRLFSRGDQVCIVYGFGNFGEAAISNVVVTNLFEMMSETGKKNGGITQENLSLDPFWGDQNAIDWSALAAGVYKIFMTLDAENVLSDKNRANNVSQFVFAIRDPLPLGDALGCADLVFDTNGDDWYGTRDGIDSTVSYARTKHLGDYGTNVLSATVTGVGVLSFDWKVSSEQDFDWLEFLIDGVVTNRISGTNCVWQSCSYELANGNHIVEWRYCKDDSYYSGLDCAWLGNVEWEVKTYNVEFHNAYSDDGGTSYYHYTTNGKWRLPAIENFTRGMNADRNWSMRNGYVFAGWATNENGNVIYDDQQVVDLMSDMVLYAQWAPDTALPDICPYTPIGWSGSLVLSTESQDAASSTVTTFSPNDVIYISHAAVNLGADFSSNLEWALYVDDSVRIRGTNWGGLSSSSYFCCFAWPIGTLSTGTHVIKVVYDYTGLVTEADESNNTVTRVVTVSGSVVRPSNDNFEDAAAVYGMSGTVTGSNVNATCQSGEPLPSVNAEATNTIWWTWTAPATGIAQFSTAGSEVNYTAMGAYVGSSVSALTKVSAGADLYSQSSISFSAVSGTRYYIAVSGTGYRYQGNVKLNWSMFTPVPLNTALDNTSLTFTTGGSANWVGVTDESYFDGSSARSGAISHNQSAWMQTEVSVEGTISFWYKVSSESYFDKLIFYVDGDQKTTASGTVGWTRFECAVSNNTQHVFKWTYSKDGVESSGSDCCWIDKVEWTPSGVVVDVKGSETVTVPRTWIEVHRTFIATLGANEDEAVRNGTAANGRKVWECYALGLDPADATNDFRIVSIEMVDGVPKVEWEPKVNRWTGAEIQAVLKGAAALEGEWKAVEGATAAEKAAMRFFKVVVEVQ